MESGEKDFAQVMESKAKKSQQNRKWQNQHCNFDSNRAKKMAIKWQIAKPENRRHTFQKAENRKPFGQRIPDIQPRKFQ
jgi:hypothetical protein